MCKLSIKGCSELHAVLGNHDYRGDVIAQLSPILRQVDSRWLCMRSFILDAGQEFRFFFFFFTMFKINTFLSYFLQRIVQLHLIPSFWYYSLSSEIAQFFFIDTTPFVKEYWANVGGHRYDWRGVNHRESYVSNLLKVFAKSELNVLVLFFSHWLKCFMIAWYW